MIVVTAMLMAFYAPHFQLVRYFSVVLLPFFLPAFGSLLFRDCLRRVGRLLRRNCIRRRIDPVQQVSYFFLAAHHFAVLELAGSLLLVQSLEKLLD